MSALIDRLGVRSTELETYLDFLENVTTHSVMLLLPQAKSHRHRPIDEKIVKILKANCFLLLYNVVEATITDGFKSMYDAVGAERCTVSQLTEQLRTLWIGAALDRVSANTANHQSYREITKDLVLAAVHDVQATLEVTALRFGGSLDAKRIRHVCDAHGLSHRVHYRARGGEKLRLVKDNRNALAHGELSFVECGRDYTAEQLREISRETLTFLRGILRNIDRYNGSKSFRIA